MSVWVRDEYAPMFGRQRLTLWEGGFASCYTGSAWELPGHDGFMVKVDYHAPVRVACPAPRTDANFTEVDDAIGAAVADMLGWND